LAKQKYCGVRSIERVFFRRSGVQRGEAEEIPVAEEVTSLGGRVHRCKIKSFKWRVSLDPD